MTLTWRKSSHSDNLGGNCVEVADLGPWRKSRRSDDQGGACIEVGALPGMVGMRDSKDPDGPKVVLSRGDFAALVNVLKG
ncbi:MULTISPECIES: DUF397 domain-containing protein [Actinomadura]|uniref:DUF397 domain-containing protein n=1 Tax=Actinomadura yumaensis TaxID=111807 RepID=A0ABW2CLZ0_9ACTN|nr:DUF397 domain-containing protein [Actinomadura sp. J1-007]MWK34292.1 DUF397 domain-containing protein [Actinomadura sp. J1-007]